MHLNILISSLLIGAACAMHLEYLYVDSDQEQDDINVDVDHAGDLPMPGAEFPGKCWACKWAMKTLKRQISSDSSKEELKNKLLRVCDNIGFLKSLCKGIINRYLDVLVEELSTSDDPATICSNIGICSRNSMLELIQAFPETQQKF